MRASIRTLCLLCLFFPTIAGAQADNWPSRAIKLIVAFPPGAGADLTGRSIGQKLSESFGVPVVVDNRVGANGSIGADAVAKAVADGYSMLLADRGAFGINPSLYKRLPYDPLKDFEYVGIATVGHYVLALHQGVPAKSYSEFISYAKSRPGLVNYASFGIGSMAQLNIEALNQRAGIKLNHIPYKGGGPAVAALVAGDVATTIVTAPSLLGHIKDGRVRAIAIGSPKRSSLLQDVPTMAELGAGEDTLIPTYFGFALPAGTSKSIVQRLSMEIRKALVNKELVEKFANVGLEPGNASPEEMLATVRADIPRFGRLVASIGIQPE